MGFMRAEEVMLPMRFLVMTAHFIAVVTIMFDLDTLASQLLLGDGSQADLYSQPQFQETRTRLRSLAASALACFAVEYAGLFAGASLFMRGHTCLYIILHFAGAVLTGLFYTRAWAIGAFAVFFAVFNCLPAALELLTLLFVMRVSVVSY
ncbi:MAG: transmembrane protein [Monoraphidium minutum]|nr:MAG: transmembrane protein [Monoraphidium minutum]